MSGIERLEFILFFAFFGFWFWVHLRGIVQTEKFLGTALGRSLYKNASTSRVKAASWIFFVAGLAFFVFAMWHLSQDTFKWKGSDRYYGFSDLFR